MKCGIIEKRDWQYNTQVLFTKNQEELEKKWNELKGLNWGNDSNVSVSTDKDFPNKEYLHITSKQGGLSAIYVIFFTSNMISLNNKPGGGNPAPVILYTMKQNLMKEFALATIDKVQEMTAAAEKAGLYLCVDVDLCRGGATIIIYERDKNDKLVTPSAYYAAVHSGIGTSTSAAKRFQENLEEAAGFIAGYTAKDLARLEKKQAELRQQLADVGKDLRKARRAANETK